MYGETRRESQQTTDDLLLNARWHFRQLHIELKRNVWWKSSWARRGCYSTRKEWRYCSSLQPFCMNSNLFPLFPHFLAFATRNCKIESITLTTTLSIYSIIDEQIFMELNNTDEDCCFLKWDSVSLGGYLLKFLIFVTPPSSGLYQNSRRHVPQNNEFSTSLQWESQFRLAVREIYWKFWRSSDRASWNILIIKPTRCTDFSNLF